MFGENLKVKQIDKYIITYISIHLDINFSGDGIESKNRQQMRNNTDSVKGDFVFFRSESR